MKKFFLPVIFSALCSVSAQVPFNQTPTWVSTDITARTTGGMFADINQDGWLDYVVANGNDMARQRVAVYYNNGNGTFPSTPGWQSADIDYHGHLDVGDVNGDGYPDVAVSVYLGASGFNSPGKVKLYLNNSGTLSSNPDWVSADNFYTFSCAFGDANGNGLLDLAVAGGESYYSHPEQARIYYNTGGMLESLPSWKSNAFFYSYDVNWFDMDNDGNLDLVFANESFPNYVFKNNNGVIGITPVWQSADPSTQANSLFTGDVNNDGWLDLAVSDNNQLGGTGKFKIYLNNNGMLSLTPFWSSDFSGYGSGIILGDIDNDGDLDLITGGWWNPVRIYLNNNGNFNTTPNYTSGTNSVVEAIFLGDVNKIGVYGVTETFIGSGSQKLFYMSGQHLQYIYRVIASGDTLQFNQYCYDLESGWISLANAPASGASVIVEAAMSWNLDMGITNWDSNIGNYLFMNTTVPVELTSFTAVSVERNIHLSWTTATELNNKGFEIHKLKVIPPGQDWEMIGFIEGNGTTAESRSYSFIDYDIKPGKYYYRLKQVDFDGTFEYSHEVEVEIPAPGNFVLGQNYPNPFNPSTTIEFQLPARTFVKLNIYDVLGNHLISLISEDMVEGYHEITFDAGSLSSGVYYYKLQADNNISVKKMILLR
jgi:hypothetical protein